MANKTSLQKSHSKWSNFKLTLLCLLTSVSVSVFWGALAMNQRMESGLFYGLLIGSGVLTILCLLLLSLFKR